MSQRNHRIRFAENNLAAASGAAVTVSSALSGFPASNLTDSYRFRTWKTGGFFEITSSNSKIYINDGSNKTVTLTSATYTYSTLASHVQTQLNASSSNWTCTYSTTTGKFTIGRSAGTKTLRLTQTTDAAWDTLGVSGASDVDAASATYVRRNHTSEYIDIDLGSAALSPTFFALIGPLGEVFSISDSATVTLKANTSASFGSAPYSVTLTPDTHGIYQFLDTEAGTSTNYRYWRLTLTDRENTVGPTGFKMGHLYLGDYTTLERRNVASGFTKTLVDSAEVVESQGGALYYQSGLKYMTYEGVELAYLDASDRRTLEQTFYDLGVSTPFYVSFDPTLLVSEDASEFTRYVVFSQAPTLTHIKSDIYTVSLSFREVM